MHMTSVSYEEFMLCEDILFELTKKQLVEKVRYYLFIASDYNIYFTTN